MVIVHDMTARLLRVVVVLSLLIGSLAIADAVVVPPAAATVPAGFTDALVVSGLTSPTALALAPDGRVFVAAQNGTVRVIKNGVLLPTPFVSQAVKTAAGSEEGLLGVTLDPGFATNHFVYIFYTTPAAGGVPSHNRVSRYTASGDVAASGSHKLMLDLPGPSATTDNGGGMRFGADGKLYVGVGDHGNGADAQSITTVKGKLLRLNTDGSVPHDNPFFATASGQNRLIWDLGLRNPARFAVQPGSGAMLVNDGGATGVFEEVDSAAAGANYGWNVTDGPTSDARFRAPLLAYPHLIGAPGAPAGCGITGGAFYNPTTPTFPSSYLGKYFFGDTCEGVIRVLDPATGTPSEFATAVGQPADLQVGNDGALYYLDRAAGSLRRVTPTPGPPPPVAPSITAQPANTTVTTGQAASFSVTADGTPPLTYQWQRDNADILGENSATLTLPSVGLADSGATFRVVVSNTVTSVTSNAATLTVTASPPPPSPGTFTDSFDRADSSNLGSDWLEVAGDLSIATNELRSAPTKNLVQLAVVPAFSRATQTVAASFARVDSNSAPRFGVVLRYQDPLDYYLFSRRTGGTSVVQISEIVNGIETVLGTKSLPNPTLNTLFRLQGDANGTTLSLRVDGTALLTVTDDEFAAGSVGIGMGSTSTSTGVSQRADNFAVVGSDATVVPTLTLTATPSNVSSGDSSQLDWTTTGADACSFTAGLAGARPTTGSESTGPLSAPSTFSMTCTGLGGSVSKSVTVSVDGISGPPLPTQLPTADQVFTTQTMDLPSSVRSFVFLVPNESHHSDVTRLISATNGWLLPMKTTVPVGATVSVISGDFGHVHTLQFRSGTTTLLDTGKLTYGALSAPITPGPGSYSLVDTVYPWIHGDITVSPTATDGTLLVGAFFLPQSRLADYQTMFPANGFTIESQRQFTYGGKVQYLLVFSTNQDLSIAGPKLQSLVKANSYG